MKNKFSDNCIENDKFLKYFNVYNNILLIINLILSFVGAIIFSVCGKSTYSFFVFLFSIICSVLLFTISKVYISMCYDIKHIRNNVCDFEVKKINEVKTNEVIIPLIIAIIIAIIIAAVFLS